MRVSRGTRYVMNDMRAHRYNISAYISQLLPGQVPWKTMLLYLLDP